MASPPRRVSSLLYSLLPSSLAPIPLFHALPIYPLLLSSVFSPSLSRSLSSSMAPELQQDGETLPQNNNTYTSDHDALHKTKVTVVGSGNWGSVAAKLIASNTLRLSSFHGISFIYYLFSTFPFSFLHAMQVWIFIYATSQNFGLSTILEFYVWIWLLLRN